MLMIVLVDGKYRFYGLKVFVLARGLNIRVFQIMRWSSAFVLHSCSFFHASGILCFNKRG